MNRGHRELCASKRWGRHIRETLVPWVIGERPLGGSVLEIGPGPGLTTDVIRSRTRMVTAIETDDAAATRLARRLTGTNVTVVNADATAMPFRGGRFSAAVAMTMLHHVPSPEAQDALLAEACRVLRPGAWLLGVDSLDSPGFRGFHRGDVCVPVDPPTLGRRLADAGFTDVEVEVGEEAVRFAARRPQATIRTRGDRRN
ncbi:MAG TPA: class I SAM-dependent methyltransferase [Candidatus Limnocylindrales bacterium]|nr:class I SAM-dependent methyltransferase [Candidatus Limnocylindrales bacterium]